MQKHGYTEIKAFVDACSHYMITCYSFQTLCAMYAYKYTGTKTFTQHPARSLNDFKAWAQVPCCLNEGVCALDLCKACHIQRRYMLWRPAYMSAQLGSWSCAAYELNRVSLICAVSVSIHIGSLMFHVNFTCFSFSRMLWPRSESPRSTGSDSDLLHFLWKLNFPKPKLALNVPLVCSTLNVRAFPTCMQTG